MKFLRLAPMVKLSIHLSALLCAVSSAGSVFSDTSNPPASQAIPVSSRRGWPMSGTPGNRTAPNSYYNRTNPLEKTAENLDKGELRYQRAATPLPCVQCHGKNGEGKGPLGKGLVPPPRNFACAETMNQLPDRQLYWVIEKGSGAFHLPSEQGAQQINAWSSRTIYRYARP